MSKLQDLTGRRPRQVVTVFERRPEDIRNEELTDYISGKSRVGTKEAEMPDKVKRGGEK